MSKAKETLQVINEANWIDVAIKELAKDQGLDPDDFKITNKKGNVFSCEASGGSGGESEWDVFKDHRSAEKEALERVEQDLDLEPELFSPDFVNRYIKMTPTDIRIVAGEEADAFMDGSDEEEGTKGWDKVHDERYNYVKKMLTKDPLDYFVHELGAYEDAGDAIKNLSILSIDTKKAAKAAVREGGVSHFLDHYDGEVIELDSGAEAYGTN